MKFVGMRFVKAALVVGSFFSATMANAGVVSVNASDTGWYQDNGTHITSNFNYITGHYSGDDYNSFFVFDLSSVTNLITGATLSLYNPSSGFSSVSATETLNIFNVLSDLSSVTGGTGGANVFNDLGSGTLFGSVVGSAADANSYIDVVLNASAISALNSAPDMFGFGGALADVSSDGVLFSGSHSGYNSSFVQLSLTTDDNTLRFNTQDVPAPGALLLLGLALLAMRVARTKR